MYYDKQLYLKSYQLLTFPAHSATLLERELYLQFNDATVLCSQNNPPIKHHMASIIIANFRCCAGTSGLGLTLAHFSA
jgi:hypothetical protein